MRFREFIDMQPADEALCAHLRESRQFMEMPLSSFRSKFVREPRTREWEGFGTVMGKTYRGRQVVVGQKGEKDIEGYFSRKDREIITHPRTARLLEQKLAGSAYRFNILMLERESAWIGDYESRQVGEFIEKNGIQTDGHITFIKNGTSGHVMTPWMILHTLGHAAFAHVGNERNIRLVFTRIINELADALCGNEEPGDSARMPNRKCLAMLGDALMFRSVRKDAEDPAYNNQDELFHELIAEFLWNGDRIRVGGPRSGGVVPIIVKKLENAVREVLDSCVGHLIFDYFG